MVRVTVDPLTRVVGPLRLDTEVNEEGIITQARSSNMIFRGFERIFQNQDPRDSVLLSQRICGVCPVAHSMASVNALDELFGVAQSVPKDALVSRNINQGLNTIANHMLHVNILWGPDLANPAYGNVLSTFGDMGGAIWKELLGRFAPISYKIDGAAIPPGSSYVDVIPVKKKIHDACAVIGGKMPHQTVTYPGGVTNKPTASDINSLSSIISDVINFFNSHTIGVPFEFWVENTYMATSPKKAVNFFIEHLNEITEKSLKTNDLSRSSGWGDVELYAAFGSELIGERLLGLPISLKHDKMGGYRDLSKIGFLSYGGFYNVEHEGYDPTSPSGDRFQTSGFMSSSFEYHKFDANKVTESVKHAFYKGDDSNKHPYDGVTEPYSDPNLINYQDSPDDKYTWSKAPRYGGIPCEVGPLSRLLIMKEPLVMGLVNMFQDNGYSPFNSFTRMIARMQEMFVITNELIKWIKIDLDPNGKFHVDIDLSMAKDSRGIGLWEAPRGALGHWVITDSNSKVANYQIVTPSSWNLSPRDSEGVPGPLEQALVGSRISAVENWLGVDFSNPTGILHVGRSYDPCVTCAVHTIDLTGKNSPGTIRLV
ncbi:methanophenazine-reducing hydrogenase, large subunit [Methanococcoides vulcani]|uniref:Methanophenazine-reducing hydrogenase, large subunit n=1 Tax=Methanococcoides vulcani TaxID=1353158 RepID=A0A1H9YDZ3_9EURY|nr:nickel-dependent hydrogenase large subunit [Methanococcoides vulcani]SES67197.1 methanophenazine-reducing hydrogenase, large subunit [Methanococcoides vulcani]